MDQENSDKLDSIHDTVRETQTEIRVIDERTKSMESRMDQLRKDVGGNEVEINDLQDTVKRNTTLLGGFVTGITAITLWAADKLKILF